LATDSFRRSTSSDAARAGNVEEKYASNIGKSEK